MTLQTILKQLLILKLRLLKLLFKKKVTVPDLVNPKFIFVHHGGGDWDFYQVNEHHKNLWGFRSSLGYYIGYQYWIDLQGKVTQARADNEEGAHTVGNTPHYYNRNSIGICLQGNTNEAMPTYAQTMALRDLIERKKSQYSLPNNKVKGHREVRGYAKYDCPGEHLWKWLIQNYPD